MGKYLPKLPFGSMAFTVVVDYSKSLKQMMDESQRLFETSLKDVSFSGVGKVRRHLYLIPFFKDPFNKSEALELVKKLGLKPALLEDLLALTRDYSNILQKREVKRVIAYGTEWSYYSQQMVVFLGMTGKFHSDEVLNTLKGGNWYLLAVAEDGIKRKIHKTPHPHLPYAQPKYPLPDFQEQVLVPAEIPNVPDAYAVNVVIDYRLTAVQMAEAAGFILPADGDIGSGTDIFSVPIVKPPNSKFRVKHRLIMVDLRRISGYGDFPVATILSLLQKNNLIPAKAENLLALSSVTREALSKKGHGRMVAFGTSWASCGDTIYLRIIEKKRLWTNSSLEEYGSSHWIPCFYNIP